MKKYLNSINLIQNAILLLLLIQQVSSIKTLRRQTDPTSQLDSLIKENTKLNNTVSQKNEDISHLNETLKNLQEV
jgi:hypothetical protein